MRTYFAAFIPEEEGYSVLFPDVAGCQTQGDSLGESFLHAMDALEGHMEALAADNDPIPEPSDEAGAWEKLRAFAARVDMPLPEGTVLHLVPAPDLDDTNVRVTMSMRKSTLDMIDKKAEATGMTRSGFIAFAARTYDAPRL